MSVQMTSALRPREEPEAIQSIAVEPIHSPVLTQIRTGQPVKPGPHKIQGIAAGFKPDVTFRRTRSQDRQEVFKPPGPHGEAAMSGKIDHQTSLWVLRPGRQPRRIVVIKGDDDGTSVAIKSDEIQKEDRIVIGENAQAPGKDVVR